MTAASQCFAEMESPQSRDLIVCLREIVYVYMTPAENVVKVLSLNSDLEPPHLHEISHILVETIF